MCGQQVFHCVSVFIYLPTGLYHDDCLYETPEVKEALRRVPAPLLNDRTFRMQRALHLSLTKKILPKEEWISYEEVKSSTSYYILSLTNPLSVFLNIFILTIVCT